MEVFYGSWRGTIKEVVEKHKETQDLQVKLFKYLLKKKFNTFHKEVIDRLIGQYNIELVKIFFKMGFKIQCSRLTWLDIVRPDRNLPSSYFPYDEEDKIDLPKERTNSE